MPWYTRCYREVDYELQSGLHDGMTYEEFMEMSHLQRADLPKDLVEKHEMVGKFGFN